MRAPAIRKKIRKKDGRMPTSRAIQSTIAKARAQPEWRGGNDWAGPGRPKIINDKLQARIVKFVFKLRGSSLVTIKFLRQRFRELRNTPRWTVSRSLQAAGLQWLRRRKKKWVSEAHREARKEYSRWILRQPVICLHALAYIDGTTFFLARGQAEAQDSGRRRLGPWVWR